MSGKRHTVLVTMWDPAPSGDNLHDVRMMLKYGNKHQDWTLRVEEIIASEDYEVIE